MTLRELTQRIVEDKNFLCVGLDPLIERIPPPHAPNPIETIEHFLHRVIDRTRSHCVAYKINWAFFERYGSEGIALIERIIPYIGPSHFLIADAKRGDIGHSSEQYARAFFEHFGVDAVTVSPYMGLDSIRPFTEYEGKCAIVLALTSNPGSADFQLRPCADDMQLYEIVVRQLSKAFSPEQLMFVAGATQGGMLRRLRAIAPDHFLLVPGVGTQGGQLEEVWKYARRRDGSGLLVNVSRGILYARGNGSWEEAVEQAARSYRAQMQTLFQLAL